MNTNIRIPYSFSKIDSGLIQDNHDNFLVFKVYIEIENYKELAFNVNYADSINNKYIFLYSIENVEEKGEIKKFEIVKEQNFPLIWSVGNLDTTKNKIMKGFKPM